MTTTHFALSTDWRMVVGLGGESVLETSLTLHRIYGFPIIPGSALKGLTRAYALSEVGEDNCTFKNIFGDQEQVGKVIFFDALPTSFPKLEVDIMNAHYPQYYQGNAPPADWQSPRPIYFLTVGPGTKLFFSLASEEKDLLNTAKEWLEGGLKELGIGGKTSAGYGYFT